MTVFGERWAGHPEVFFERWRATVGPEDLVVVPGDISWAMKLEAAMPDLLAIAELPGKKVILRGNHDYWWSSISRLRQALPEGMWAIQNDAIAINGVAVAGTRGWVTPHDKDFTENDHKIYRREIERLKLSLSKLRGLSYRRLVLAFHYPPFGPGGEPTGFTDLIEKTRPDAVVYGHLHGADPAKLPQSWNGTPLYLVAADAIQFRPQLIFSL